jgi:drug/metabolite transporter (DMT)-like permease
VLYLALSGVAELVFCDTLLYKAFQTIGARITMVIVSLGPAISTLLAYIFLHEVLSFWAIAGICITLLGIMLVISERTASQAQQHVSGWGIVLALLAALGQGVGIILSKQAFLEGPIHGFLASLIRMSVGLLVLLPIALLLKRYPNPIHTFIRHKKTFLLLLAGSIVGPFLGITLSLVAIAHTQVGIAATLLATSPIMMLPMVRIIYKEVLSWKAIAGACMAVGGVAMLFLI